MIGYKVFNPDWTCRGFQYSVGKTFEEDVMPSCRKKGFHFCTELNDCFNCYPFELDPGRLQRVGIARAISVNPKIAFIGVRIS